MADTEHKMLLNSYRRYVQICSLCGFKLLAISYTAKDGVGVYEFPDLINIENHSNCIEHLHTRFATCDEFKNISQ